MRVTKPSEQEIVLTRTFAAPRESVFAALTQQEPARSGVTRLIAGYAAIIFILPYLAIKIAWISGLPLGMPNRSLVADLAMIALNILTFCMDAVAILLALAFTHSWGLRVPAWLLLFPIWVGTGFLAPIVIAVPMNVLARALGLDSGQSPPRSRRWSSRGYLE